MCWICQDYGVKYLLDIQKLAYKCVFTLLALYEIIWAFAFQLLDRTVKDSKQMTENGKLSSQPRQNKKADADN